MNDSAQFPAVVRPTLNWISIDARGAEMKAAWGYGTKNEGERYELQL